MKKRVLFFIIGMITSGLCFAQLTGTKSIPGDYATVAIAIADLNASGVGEGGVTFLIADGYTETFLSPSSGLIAIPLGNPYDPVLFRKSGNGVNPVITAAPGTGVADYILCISGTSNITFDGITVMENPSNISPDLQMEWGFAILKASATQGSQNVVIQNCTINLDKSNYGSAGIYMDNVTIAEPATQLTVTAFSGTNSGNKFYNNTLSNVNRGIYISGYADENSTYAFYDQNNDIGSLGGNQVTNFGGGNMGVYGIYAAYQNALIIANSTINGGTGTTGPLYGIYGGTANKSNVNIYGNAITLSSSGTTAGLYGIYNAGLGNGGTTNTLNFYNNSVLNCSYNTATAITFYGIYNVATAGIINMYGNILQNNITAGTSSQYLIYSNSTSGNLVNIYNNTISGNQCSGGGTQTNLSYIFGIQTIGWGTMSVHDNQVINNSIPNQTQYGAAIYAIHGGFSAQNLTIYNNIIHDLSISSTATNSTSHIIYGIYCSVNSFSNSATNSVYGNTISNLFVTLSSNYGGYVYGILGGYVNNIYSNTINNIQFTNTLSGYGYGAGISYSNGGIGHIFKNNIFDVSMEGTAAYFNGIIVNSGDNVNIYNNFISDLRAPSSTSLTALSGININNPVKSNIYYNSIYLNATSNSFTNFGTSGVYASTNPLLVMRNNLIVNTSSAPSSTTYKTVSFRRSSTTFGSYSTASNNNDFYAGTPSATNLIFYDGLNSIQTLSDYKVFAVQRDANSISELPPFANIDTQPFDLHIKTSVANQCESGGSEISGVLNITTDFDGTPRYPNPGYPANPIYPPAAPDMGAAEFAGIPLDITPPSILFNPLEKTSSTSERTLTATIADASGVPVAGLGLPVLYWKKFAAGSWNAATAVWVGGNTYNFTFGSGVITNDSIYYYIVAQDLATPDLNVGATPSNVSGYTTMPPACSVPPPNASCYSYKIVGTLCGNIRIGTGETYTTITAAVNDLNNMEVTCPIVFLLTDATYPSETFPLVITNPTGVNETNTVTFRPAPGVTPTIAGSGTAVFKFIQAGFITIDGSNSEGTDRSLTISNTISSGTTTVIWIGSNGTGMGSANNVIKNCIISNGYATTTSYGVFIGSSTTLGSSGDDNDNFVLSNNDISRAYRGIWAQASANGMNDNLVITNNDIGSNTPSLSITNYAIYLAGANEPLISGNLIKNMINNISSTICAIELNSNVTNAMITGNSIHDLKSTSSMGPAVYGINVGTSINVVNATIANNIIYNITSTQYAAASTQYNPFGIRIVSGSGHKLYHNTINMAGTQSPPGTSASLSAALVFPYPIVSGLDIRNNIFANSIIGLAGSSSYCVYAVAGSSFGIIDNNDYYPSGTYGILGFLGAAKTTLPAWQSATNQDIASQNADPMYVSASDLHVTAPALNNAGIFIPSVTTDYDGIARTNPPDVGAYEFILPIATINTLDATLIGVNNANLAGDINSNGEVVTVSFEYGTDLTYGSSVNALPSPVRSITASVYSATVTGLNAGTLYYFREKGVSTTSGETIYGHEMTFTTLSVPANTTVENITIGNGQVICYDATETITVAGNGTTFEIQPGGSATMIAGQNILFLPGAAVQAGGYLHGFITTTYEYCGSIPPPLVAVKMGEEESPLNISQVSFSIYPNPTNGNFTLVQKGDKLFDHVKLEVYSMHGEKVMTESMIGAQKRDFSLSGMITGIYFVKVVADGYVETIKLVKL